MRVVTALVALCLWVSPGVFGTVMVDVLPSNTAVTFGETFDVSIVATILPGEEVIAWGLDLGYDSSIVSHDPATGVSLGGLWAAFFAADGDELSGVAVDGAGDPTSVSGSGILLATLSFTAIAEGVSSIFASVSSDDVDAGLEGFWLDPMSPDFDWSRPYADVVFGGGSVTVGLVPPPVPEPMTALLMGVGVGAVAVFRRRSRRGNASAA